MKQFTLNLGIRCFNKQRFVHKTHSTQHKIRTLLFSIFISLCFAHSTAAPITFSLNFIFLWPHCKRAHSYFVFHLCLVAVVALLLFSCVFFLAFFVSFISLHSTRIIKQKQTDDIYSEQFSTQIFLRYGRFFFAHRSSIGNSGSQYSHSF